MPDSETKSDDAAAEETVRSRAPLGRVLGDRYRIQATLGTGSSARVFLADDLSLNRQVAVKCLHAGLGDDARFLRRFRAEAQAAARLSHPNLLAVYDWGEDAATAYLVTEVLLGGSLLDLIEHGPLLSPSQGLLVGLQVAQGLNAAHDLGWVHRDIKPANLLFDTEGRLRIADFGIARAVAEAAWTEPEGILFGTARYAAPEQAEGDVVDGKADVYSLALTVVEAVTGEVPLLKENALATMVGRQDRDIGGLGHLGPLGRALAPAGRADPAARPTAAELTASLIETARSLPRPRRLPLHVHRWLPAGSADEHRVHPGDHIMSRQIPLPHWPPPASAVEVGDEPAAIDLDDPEPVIDLDRPDDADPPAGPGSVGASGRPPSVFDRPVPDPGQPVAVGPGPGLGPVVVEARAPDAGPPVPDPGRPADAATAGAARAAGAEAEVTGLAMPPAAEDDASPPSRPASDPAVRRELAASGRDTRAETLPIETSRSVSPPDAAAPHDPAAPSDPASPSDSAAPSDPAVRRELAASGRDTRAETLPIETSRPVSPPDSVSPSDSAAPSDSAVRRELAASRRDTRAETLPIGTPRSVSPHDPADRPSAAADPASPSDPVSPSDSAVRRESPTPPPDPADRIEPGLDPAARHGRPLGPPPDPADRIEPGLDPAVGQSRPLGPPPDPADRIEPGLDPAVGQSRPLGPPPDPADRIEPGLDPAVGQSRPLGSPPDPAARQSRTLGPPPDPADRIEPPPDPAARHGRPLGSPPDPADRIELGLDPADRHGRRPDPPPEPAPQGATRTNPVPESAARRSPWRSSEVEHRPVRLIRLFEDDEPLSEPPTEPDRPARSVVSLDSGELHGPFLDTIAPAPAPGPVAAQQMSESRRPQWLVMAVLLTLIFAMIAGVAVIAIRTERIEPSTSAGGLNPSVVGDYVGRPVSDIEVDIAANSWHLSTVEGRRDGVAPGHIIEQSPAAGQELPSGGRLSVIVSIGDELREVPDLGGQPLDEAEATITAAGLTLGVVTERHDDEVDEGVVLAVRVDGDQPPTRLERGAALDLVVSAGPTTRPMPSFVGLDRDRALDQAQDLGLIVEETERFSERYEAGVVIDTDPPTDTPIRAGDELTLVMSRGQPFAAVPDVVGLDLDEATAQLVEAGFDVTIDGPADQPVVATSPAAGETHRQGTAIALLTAPS